MTMKRPTGTGGKKVATTKSFLAPSDSEASTRFFAPRTGRAVAKTGSGVNLVHVKMPKPKVASDNPLAAARARASTIPDSFYSWLDCAPGWPENEPEVLGPQK
jgi:hypothetical protein